DASCPLKLVVFSSRLCPYWKTGASFPGHTLRRSGRCSVGVVRCERAVVREGRERGAWLLRPYRDRDRAGDQNEIIEAHVRGLALIDRHDELIVEPEQVEADAPIDFVRQHVSEPHRPDRRIAAAALDLNTDARDRIEIPEIQRVLARLRVDPGDRRLDRE